MTNVFSSVILCLVIDIEREMEYSTKKVLPLNSIEFAGTPHHSPLWYNLHSYLFVYQRGRKFEKGLIFHSQVSVFGDSCQRGRKYEPKAKGPHHHRILKMKFFKLISYCVQKGEKVVSSKLAKPS
jgi:hypothetical protein